MVEINENMYVYTHSSKCCIMSHYKYYKDQEDKDYIHISYKTFNSFMIHDSKTLILH